MISVKNKSCLALGIAALMAAGAGVAVAEDKAPEMVDTIAAVAIAVDDLETASAFYETALGLKMMREDQGPTYVERIMAAPVDMGGTKLVLFKSLDGSATPQPARIIFFTKDAVAAMSNVVEAGGSVIKDAAPIAEGSPYVIGFASDLDGHTIEFIQRPE